MPPTRPNDVDGGRHPRRVATTTPPRPSATSSMRSRTADGLAATSPPLLRRGMLTTRARTGESTSRLPDSKQPSESFRRNHTLGEHKGGASSDGSGGRRAAEGLAELEREEEAGRAGIISAAGASLAVVLSDAQHGVHEAESRGRTRIHDAWWKGDQVLRGHCRVASEELEQRDCIMAAAAKEAAVIYREAAKVPEQAQESGSDDASTSASSNKPVAVPSLRIEGLSPALPSIGSARSATGAAQAVAERSLLHYCEAMCRRLRSQAPGSTEVLNLTGIIFDQNLLGIVGDLIRVEHTAIRSVVLNHSTFPSGGFAGLLEAISECTTLHTLHLSTIKGAEPEDWEGVLSVLPNSLEELDVSGNPLTEGALKALAELTAKGPVSTVRAVQTGALEDDEGQKWLMDAVRSRLLKDSPVTLVLAEEDGVGLAVGCGWTSLHSAAFVGDSAKIQQLIDDDTPCNYEARDGFGNTPIHLCCLSGCTDGLAAMLSDIQTQYLQEEVLYLVSVENKLGHRPLQEATSRCHTTCASLMISAGATVDSRSFESALKLLIEHNDCVAHPPPQPEHRKCCKARWAVEGQLRSLSPHAHAPFRSVALRLFLPDFLLYTLFLLVLTLFAAEFTTNFGSEDYMSTKVIKDRMEGTESLPGMEEEALPDFRTMSTIPELWEWCDTVLLNVIKEAHLDNPFDIVGAFRLRQVRVQKTSCENPGGATQDGGGCYSSFDEMSEDRSPLRRLVGDEEREWEWKELDEVQAVESVLGEKYGSGGYVEDVPVVNLTETHRRIAALRKAGWVDDASRAVFIDLTFYKRNTGKFLVCHLLFELPLGGGLIPSLELVSLRLNHRLPWAVEVALPLFAIKLAWDEVHDAIRWARRPREGHHLAMREKHRLGVYDGVVSFMRHLRGGWNTVDLVMVIMLAAVLWGKHALSVEVAAFDLTSVQSLTGFVSFSSISYRTRRLRDTLGLLVAISWVKTLKYLTILPLAGPTVDAIVATVINTNILTFMTLFVIISLSLSLGLHFTLGNTIKEFSTVTDAGLSFFRMVFGDFNVDS
eukprot:Sspe_Gene.2929::Locus_975_Transcript_1_1_Confidence_1.000_Length_3164::g.2929::m.2929/K04986/PKD2; polycystin 2